MKPSRLWSLPEAPHSGLFIPEEPGGVSVRFTFNIDPEEPADPRPAQSLEDGDEKTLNDS